MERAQAQSVPVNRSGAALPPASPSRMPGEPRRLKKGLYRFYPDSPCFIFLCQFLCLHTLRTNSAFRFFIFLIPLRLFFVKTATTTCTTAITAISSVHLSVHTIGFQMFSVRIKAMIAATAGMMLSSLTIPLRFSLPCSSPLFTARRMELRSFALFGLVLLPADEVARKQHDHDDPCRNREQQIQERP